MLLGGAALALLNWATLLVAGHPWTITWGFTLWAAKVAVAHSTNGAASNGSGPPKAYAAPLHWTVYVELLVMGYCVWGAVVLVQGGEALWAIAMALWAACLALVVQQQLVRPSG